MNDDGPGHLFIGSPFRDFGRGHLLSHDLCGKSQCERYSEEESPAWVVPKDCIASSNSFVERPLCRAASLNTRMMMGNSSSSRAGTSSSVNSRLPSFETRHPTRSQMGISASAWPFEDIFTWSP